jgi:hypothetical protein
MTSTSIYSILSSKPHNPQYLKLYIKYIYRCKRINTSKIIVEYTEKHHICPKAKDLFPEYKSLSIYKWNKIELTKNQHICAHVFLAKVFSQGGMKFAAKLMKSDSREVRKITTAKLHLNNLEHSCIWCNKSIKGGNFFRHHGDNCKLNPTHIDKSLTCPHCNITCDVANYGRAHGDNCRIIVGIKDIKYNRSEETKERQSKSGKGRILSDETKQKQRKPKAELHKQNLRKPKNRFVYDIFTKKGYSEIQWFNKTPNLQKDLENLSL